MIVAAIYLKEPVTGKKVIGIFLGSIGALTLILSSQGSTDGKGGGFWHALPADGAGPGMEHTGSSPLPGAGL